MPLRHTRVSHSLALTLLPKWLQELQARGVAREHISSALSAVFGSDQQRLPSEPLSEQEEGAAGDPVVSCLLLARLVQIFGCLVRVEHCLACSLVACW